MILDSERLRQHARELALQHNIRMARRQPQQMWRTFLADAESIRTFVRVLQDSLTGCSQPAEEWLLDHADFIQEQVVLVRRELTKAYLRRMPRLKKLGDPRVQSLCAEYLECVEGAWKADSFVAFVHAYQEVSVLTIAEAWSIPIFLRVTLIRRLAKVVELVRERREACAQVDRLLARIEPAQMNPTVLMRALDEAQADMPLSGPLIVHLVSHLSEWTNDAATVREWLMCKLDNGAESLDRIVSYEHQLQAGYHVSAGNIIQSMQKVVRWTWPDLFEEMCLVDHTLRDEATGVYQQLDFSSRDLLRQRVEELARLLRIPESLVAKQAVELSAIEVHRSQAALEHQTSSADADGAPDTGPRTADDLRQVSRQTFVAYYLYEKGGVKDLRRALRACAKPRPLLGRDVLRPTPRTYFASLGFFFAIVLGVFTWWIGRGVHHTWLAWLTIVVAAALPVSEWTIPVWQWVLRHKMQPWRLLRFDFSRGVPAQAATMVVIPVIWSTPEEVHELVERLELHYLANRDSNIHFAILGDFVDSATEHGVSDETVLQAARVSIEGLNETYGGCGGSTFYVFHRHRLWNSQESVWMGWERKRGKLVEFVDLLKGSSETSYDLIVGDASLLPHIRYVITLDMDTQLPVGSAARMIGTMHLPYNRPRLNETRTRIVEGYGVLQPRIGMEHDATMRSRFAYIWTGEPGIDPYTFALSDPYQDAFGQGIFTGKGIFDVDAFAQVICNRIPQNKVLSHDLLEGGLLRAGLISDIELIDGHPTTFSAHQQRLHRWVRGDWQLICWLLPRVPDRSGTPITVDLSSLTRWQIIDNLRRSLLTPALFALFILGLTVLPGSALAWVMLALSTLALPLVRQFISISQVLTRPHSLLATAGQVGVTILTLPYQAVLMMDAIGKTLYRMQISGRHLLEWVSAAEVERQNGNKRRSALLGLRGGFVFILAFAIAVTWRGLAPLQGGAAVFVVLWSLAPLVVRWLDQPMKQTPALLSAEQEQELRQLAKQIWSFFDHFAGEEDNWLPPDNIQVDPPNGVAHRTSPTNIGLLLACTLSARDFGFIDTPVLLERLERTLGTVEGLAKWQGHLYNWYDTITLTPLPPLYVSTVDSGNFVAYLVTVKEGVRQWLETDFALGASTSDAHWLERGRSLTQRLEALIQATDFRPLYDHRAKLFALGYHVALAERETILYDLLASEARHASFLAIALGQVSVSHWFALGRTMIKVGRRPTLLAWSGTMFEYLMPWLTMRTYANTIWDSTYRGVVSRQVDYARQRGVPFGISESGYHAFDFQMNYQYRAFGVPGLGFKRGLEQDLVVSPYATILALPFALQQGLTDLRKLAALGGRGEYGYYEAIDFTRERLPNNQPFAVIQSFMAHHQGMSMLTLSNLLSPHKMYERFHCDKRVQAVELLLQERIPARPSLLKHPAVARVRPSGQQSTPAFAAREYVSEDTPTPEVCILSNGSFLSVVTNNGSGFSRCKGVALTRWREDPVADNWGSYMYIRDVTRDVLWSPTFQPTRVFASEQRTQFALDRATFMRANEGVQSSLEVCVAPEWDVEVRRLTLTNTGDEQRIIEVTTFAEIALATAIADDAHPAFSKLFVETQFAAAPECLLACRRPRDGDEKPLWAVHSLIVADQPLGAVEYETDRARFIGGHGHTLAAPKGIRSRLCERVGAVADPAFVMRRRLTMEPGDRLQLYAITGVAATKDEAVSLVGRFSEEHQVERTFQLAWTRTQIELRHLHLTSADALVFQTLAGQALYTGPLQGTREKSIAVNVKGPSGLWALGISGDLPIILVRVEDIVDLPFVVKLLRGHQYLRRMGLRIDLIVLNESSGGYQQGLQDSVRHAIENGVEHDTAGGPIGVFPIAANQLNDEQRVLLFAATRLVLRAGGPSLGAQLQRAAYTVALPELLQPTPRQPVRGTVQVTQGSVPDLLFFNGWGGFSRDGKEYSIMLKNGDRLPAPWINVIANPRFGCLVSELGSGYTWWRNSRECKLTRWSNDPVLDGPGEVCYLRDEETSEMWPVTPGPGHSDQPFLVSHGRGYTRFSHESHGIAQDMTVFIALEDDIKVATLRLTNRSNQRRSLSVTYYAEWVLGVQREANASWLVAEWEPAADALLVHNVYQEAFRDGYAFLSAPANTGSGATAPVDERFGPDLSWTADRNEFIGRNRTLHDPVAMKRKHLSGKVGPTSDTCGAIQRKVTLEPDAQQTVYVLLGCQGSRQDALQLARKFSDATVCDQALMRVRGFWDELLTQIIVSTPCSELDVLLNGWLLYQTLSCRMWARAAFYQAGGAYGFRDQLQDSLALLHTRPELTRAQILLHAAHQYEEGDVQHWWHEETRRGIRTRFSDDLLWLPYAVIRYVEHTMDEGVLDEVVPYLHSEPLREGEHERYESTETANVQETVFEHCVRALERALRFGEHGLPLIGIGDWNDGLNRVGDGGRGESVWLGWFLADVLGRFAALCERRAQGEQAARYRKTREDLALSLDQHAWDGQWFRRACTDDGQWLGSIHNHECRIDAIAQSWAVLSDVAPKDRARQAMQAFDRELVDRAVPVASLLTPPFDQTAPSPGYIQGYPPGIRENGGQYTHGIIWSIIAWCRLGDGDKAFELFHLVNPLTHTKTAGEVRQYVGEPYAMAADVYTTDPHKGRAGWTWYTGAAGWMYQAGVEWILGLRRRGQLLYIRPCIPREWPGFSVRYQFGNASYHIEVKNPLHKCQGVSSLVVDGMDRMITGEPTADGPHVELLADGQVHQVVLTI